MDKVLNKRRYLVVTPNIVVGEDLKEALLTYRDADVELVSTLDKMVAKSYEIAIFGLPLDVVLHDRAVRALHNAGTQVVILNGHFPAKTLEGTGVVALSQPFSSEDVEALVQRVEMTAKAKV
ncbi:MAG: hypothetical protein AAFQ18_01210 [Pseudomonadota bacterium]